MPLGSGTYTVYLYDRGGESRLGEFRNILSLQWSRTLAAVSSATLRCATPPDDPACCEFLGAVRSMRHELVVFRNDERVWEGPITRITFERDAVEMQARDVLFWLDRRVSRGRFTNPTNAVNEAAQMVRDAFTFDPAPNVTPFLEVRSANAPLFTTAVNRADETYLDTLDDIVDAGVYYTAVGRRVVVWSATALLGRTFPLVAGVDIEGDVSVIEDGLALATRVVAVGGDTFGATTPEPDITNFAANPSLEANATGYRSPTYFLLARQAGTWGTGRYYGQVTYNPPVLSGPATQRAKDVYNQRISDAQAAEVCLLMDGQRISCHPEELISATLDVRGLANPQARLGLRLRGYVGGVMEDRAFSEGPPIGTSANVTRTLFVSGKVPNEVTQVAVEVYRDTEVKWTNRFQGFNFDRFGLWRGRIETWFDGSSPNTAEFTHSWLGGPNVSASRRLYCCPTVEPYYGLVEQLDSSGQGTSRTALEAEARALLSRSYPAPLLLDVPQNAPLTGAAPVTIAELVAGTTVPVTTTITCRAVQADCLLAELAVNWDAEGERVTVTLVSGQSYELDLMGTAMDPYPLEVREAWHAPYVP